LAVPGTRKSRNCRTVTSEPEKLEIYHPTVPIIVVGADTAAGRAIVEGLLTREGEVRVFVSDAEAADRFRTRGAKVAIGDVSDGSHVGSAALRTFAAALVAEAATDGRELSFAEDAAGVYRGWAEGVRDAAVARLIWVGAAPPAEILTAAPDVIHISADQPVEVIAAEVVAADAKAPDR
jgi:putative NADH-flavin reductase